MRETKQRSDTLSSANYPKWKAVCDRYKTKTRISLKAERAPRVFTSMLSSIESIEAKVDKI